MSHSRLDYLIRLNEFLQDPYRKRLLNFYVQVVVTNVNRRKILITGEE